MFASVHRLVLRPQARQAGMILHAFLFGVLLALLRHRPPRSPRR
jgi:hypothetical protein